MDNNIIISKKAVFLYTLPVLCSEILEELMILSDSILLSFKEPVFLATVGIVDSIYLMFLAMGESLNDAFQNYYARHLNDRYSIGFVFKPSLLVFTIIPIVACVFLLLFIALVPPSWIGFKHYDVLFSSRWYLCGLIIITYISLSINSLLMGLGKTKTMGLISLLTVIVNLILGILFLFVLKLNINPCGVILLTSSIADVLAIFLMIYVYARENKLTPFCSVKNSHAPKIVKILTESSIYPCITDFAFHIGSIILYLYCLYYFIDEETAIFTLLMAYWGIIQVPAESFSETSLNYFSYFHSQNLENRYYQIKSIVLSHSALISISFGFFIILFDNILYGFNETKMQALLLIIVIALLNSRLEIISTSLIARLKTDYYLIVRLIYGFSSLTWIALFTTFADPNYMHIFISFLLSLIISLIYLSHKEKQVWYISKNLYGPES